MKTRNVIVPAMAVLYAFLWLGGVGSYLLLGGPPDHVAWAGPLFMALSFALTVVYTSGRFRVALVIAGIVGFAAEVAGVRTGIPFGRYHYTTAFAPLLFEVPVVMLCAWSVLTAYTWALLVPAFGRGYRTAALATLHLVAIDLVLDPVAAGPMDLWRWASPGDYYGIPLTNFAGWTATAFVVHMLVARWGDPPSGNRALVLIGEGIVTFFTVLAIGAGLLVPAAVGIVLCAVHVLAAARWRAILAK